MVNQNPGRKAAVLVDYTYAVVKGVLATLAFALGSYWAAKMGHDLWPVLGASLSYPSPSPFTRL
jgi:hypothetical protein